MRNIVNEESTRYFPSPRRVRTFASARALNQNRICGVRACKCLRAASARHFSWTARTSNSISVIGKKCTMCQCRSERPSMGARAPLAAAASRSSGNTCASNPMISIHMRYADDVCSAKHSARRKLPEPASLKDRSSALPMPTDRSVRTRRGCSRWARNWPTYDIK